MTKIEELVDEFRKDMLQKFADHDHKWGENSVTKDDWEGTIILNEDEIRKEIHYHYAKWLYRGIVKKTLPEEDTLTNLANVIFMLWLKIKKRKE